MHEETQNAPCGDCGGPFGQSEVYTVRTKYTYGLFYRLLMRWGAVEQKPAEVVELVCSKCADKRIEALKKGEQ